MTAKKFDSGTRKLWRRPSEATFLSSSNSFKKSIKDLVEVMDELIWRRSAAILPFTSGIIKTKQIDVVGLVEERRWDRLRRHLDTPEGWAEVKLRSEDRDVLGRNLLHLLCTRRPPGDVVRTVLSLCRPSLAYDPDVTLRTPLHVAVAHSADRSLVERLLRACPPSAIAGDLRGKTPLALAAEMASRENAGSIRSLLLLQPLATILEDESGVTPVEHAIAAGAPLDIVSRLQMATTRARRDVRAAVLRAAEDGAMRLRPGTCGRPFLSLTELQGGRAEF